MAQTRREQASESEGECDDEEAAEDELADHCPHAASMHLGWLIEGKSDRFLRPASSQSSVCHTAIVIILCFVSASPHAMSRPLFVICLALLLPVSILAVDEIRIEMHMSDCPFANVGINNPLKLDYISLMSVDKDDNLTDKILLHTALGGQFMNSEIVFGNATAPYDKPKVWNVNDKLKVVLRYRTISLNGDNNNDFYGFNPNLIESTTDNGQLPCYDPSRWIANHGIYVVEPGRIKFNNMYYDPSVLQLGNRFT
ncbi:hypothetical protein WR25_02575 [Diploscapter pachys]|uniref:Uncharacterized protein n=1 Tax=Diploscapter pachys TaxID=2018661 RepID=A0A2A2LA33_9BILA|nr:hypothetical protein WR25_02575 [Diploscapter pachys]